VSTRFPAGKQTQQAQCFRTPAALGWEQAAGTALAQKEALGAGFFFAWKSSHSVRLEAPWGEGQTLSFLGAALPFHLICFNTCFLPLSFQQVSGQTAVWPGRCGLGQPWDGWRETLPGWVRSQGAELGAFVGWPRSGLGLGWLPSLCLADPIWPQMEMRFAEQN